MPTGDSISRPRSNTSDIITIWDSQYVPSSKAFGLYRETLCKVYMPWSPEHTADGEFQARIETAKVGNGSVSRHRSSPHMSTRTVQDIAKSPIECSYLVRILAGQIQFQQSNSLTFGNAGDNLLLDSSSPTCARMGPAPFDALVITIPKSELPGPPNANYHHRNALLNRERTPLSKCLSLMAHLMPSGSKDELSALYDAARSLLPIEAGSFDGGAKDEELRGPIHHLLRGILSHIDQNIANTELTPNHVADQFGISVRYVHKLFIGYGMTFRSYATARRLDHVCKDLISPASRQQPISRRGFPLGLQRSLELQSRIQEPLRLHTERVPHHREVTVTLSRGSAGQEEAARFGLTVQGPSGASRSGDAR